MGTKYATNTISGYDASAVADDGSEVAANKITFASVTSNLSEPLKDLAEAINTDLVNHFDIASDAVKDTSPYAVDADDDRRIVLIDATSGAFTVNLGAAATLANGFEVLIKKTDSSTNAVTIDASGTETIDGELTYALSLQYAWARLRCDGSNWHTVGRGIVPGLHVDIAGTETETTVDGDADTVLMYDDSASLNREVLTRDVAGIHFDEGDIILIQTADDVAPSGWTKLTTTAYDNAAIRVVATPGAGNDGGNAFTTAFNSNRTTSGSSDNEPNTATGVTSVAESSHTHTINLDVNYCDVMAIQKDADA